MADVNHFRSLLTNVCVLLIIGFAFSNGQTTLSKNVVCIHYYMSVQMYGYTFYNISDIDFASCTHLVYEFANMNPDLTVDTSGMFHVPSWEQIQQLRPLNPKLKVIISLRDTVLGGATYEDRQTLFKNIIDFLRSWDFDGFGFLTYRGIDPGWVTIMEEIHAALAAEAESNGRDPLILMMSASGTTTNAIQNGADLQRLTQAVDIFYVKTMDYFGGGRTTALTTQLYGNADRPACVSESVNYYLEAGMIPEKLHIGISIMATTFTLSDPQRTDVGAPISDQLGKAGEYSRMQGRITHYEMCKLLNEGGYTTEFDPEGLVNFAYKGDQWMTYEDSASLAIKMGYVYEQNLGGVVAYWLHTDDYTGDLCNRRYPLVSTLHRFSGQDTTATIPPQPCLNSYDRKPGPYSCQHYIQCVYDMPFKSQCEADLSYDAAQIACVQNPLAACVTPPPQTCPNGTDTFPDPYSCQQYRMCVFDMLFRVECDDGLSYDAQLKDCVQNPTTACVTVPPPTSTTTTTTTTTAPPQTFTPS